MLFSLVMTVSLCVGIVFDARTEFENARGDAIHSVAAVAEVLTVEIRERRSRAALLVGQHDRFLEEILDSGDPDARLMDFASLMESWFPNALAFTLGDAAGNPVLTDFKGSIGAMCLEDMRRSVIQNIQMVPLHGTSSVPHYDLVNPVSGKGVLLVTFTTQSLQNFLARHTDTRFSLGYSKAGDRQDREVRHGHALFVSGLLVEGTDIRIHAVFRESYVDAVDALMWRRLVGYGGGFALFSGLVGWLLWTLRSHVRQDMRRIESLNHELERLSRNDPLTGLNNRRGMEAHLMQLPAQARRENKPFCLAMFDIDHFKRINDVFGHPQGDLCLKRVGEILAQHARRPNDCAIRYGGEEFLLCWYDVPVPQIQEIIEDIRRQVEFAYRHANGDPLTLSAGVCCVPQGESVAIETLIQRVDAALYRAKQNGRNRIEWG